MSLSPAALIVLTRAAERPDHRLQFHRKLPTGGRHKMIDALLRDGLITETLGDYRLGDASTLIEDSATGLMLTTLALTDAGFRAIGQEPPAAEPAAPVAPTVPSPEEVATEAQAVADALDAATVAPTPRANLRAAAAAVLAAWDDQDNRDTDIIAALEAPMEALRILLAGTAPREVATPRKPREGTKQEAVITLLRRTEGATVAQIAEATGWASHTVRGFLAGLKKKGIKVETLEKVRMVGPNKEGAKGSYTVYRAG
jgi:hypothetical protein